MLQINRRLLLGLRIVRQTIMFSTVVACAGTLFLLAYFVYLVGSISSPPPRNGIRIPLSAKAPPQDGDAPEFQPAPQPGVRLPPTCPLGAAHVDDNAEVIGVWAEGRSRAYLVSEMGWPKHVVNDVLEGHPVSVTYCDRRGCARVFTAEHLRGPLEMDVGGWVENKGMAVRVNGVDYLQETGENVTSSGGEPIPYREMPHTRTSWRAWREAHPDTDIYVGDQPVG